VAVSFPGSLHLAAHGGGRRDRQFIERVRDSAEMLAGQVQIDDGVADVGMAEELLKTGQIGPGLEQVSGVAVA
jgi:hypothetical protein